MMKQLERAIDDITEIAKGFGLDFYPMRYEICPAHIIYQFGAYGMPTRYSHWSFGKQYHKMKLHYDLGLSQIYELVINSNPCYAFLLDTNSLIQNKLIVAHVLAHSDFFKHNYYFQETRFDMVDSMAATSDRIKQYESEFGKQKVESFLDAVLAIQEHIDPYKRNTKAALNEEKDLLLFIEQQSPVLQDWQADILTTIREEMLYFWPQLETKIMNEGWATYWHQRIIRELNLTDEEWIEYAKLNASVVQPSSRSLNPYYFGLKMFEHIEKLYNHPSREMKRQGVKENSGREKIFEIRKIDNDSSFIRNYLTKQFVEEEDLFIYKKRGKVYRITDKDFASIREQLIASRTNGGFPYIVVKDGNYMRNGELYLLHHFDGSELDIEHLEQVLQYVFQLWGKSVHLETVLYGSRTLFSYNGLKHFRKKIYVS